MSDITVEFSYAVEAKVTMRHTEGEATSKLVDAENRILHPVNTGIDYDAWFDVDGNPNADGVKASTIALVAGIASNIHYAHQSGLWDSAEHMRYAIARLEEMFVNQAKLESRLKG